MNNIYKANFTVVTVMYIISFLSINYIEQTYIVTNERIRTSFSDRPDIDRIESILEEKQEVSIVDSAFFGVKILGGFYLVVVSFFISAQVSGFKINFQNLSKIILVAYVSFLVAYLIKVLWFLVIDDFTLKEFNSFYPVSLMNFFDHEEIDYWMINPLQYINAFQILFILLVSVGLVSFLKIKPIKSFIWSSITYSTILIFWIALIAFVQLSLF